MQQFRFRMERVHQWQLKMCQIAEDRVRAGMLAVSETDDKLTGLLSARSATEKEFTTLAALAAADLWALARFRAKITENMRALQQEKEARLAVVNEERKRLRAERYRLRILERIRERDLQDYTRASDRAADQLALDSYLSKWVSGIEYGDQSGKYL